MLLPPPPSALSARSPDGFVSPWPWEQAAAVCPVQACLLLLEGTLPGLEVAARASVLTDSILCPAPQCVSGAPRPGPPHLPLLSLSSSLVLRLRQCSLPPSVCQGS